MKKQKHKRLAEGEVTGHSHKALAVDAEIWADEDDNRELISPSGTSIVHEEHKQIDLPAGDFDISIQNEIDPFEEEIRRVQD